MNILQKAMEHAGTPDENSVVQAVALLSETPQEVAQADDFLTSPISGYDAAQIALRLFEGGHLDEFADFLQEKKLSPNIVLANGLTLLQNSLINFPQDAARIYCLLELGANPNLFMRRIEEKGLGNRSYRLGYHPLNYAFANCPQLVAPEICMALRKYGAIIEGVKYRLEIDPDLAMPDDEFKTALRRSLIVIVPDPECTKLVRKDVDLSVIQKELVSIEKQLAAAGFEVVHYAPPPTPLLSSSPDAMTSLPENYIIMTSAEAFKKWKELAPENRARELLGFPGDYKWTETTRLAPATADVPYSIEQSVFLKLLAEDADRLFPWVAIGGIATTRGTSGVSASLKTKKFIFIKNTEPSQFRSHIVGIFTDNQGRSLFYDPLTCQVRLIDTENKSVSVNDRGDLIGQNIHATFENIEWHYDYTKSQLAAQEVKSEIDIGARPNAALGSPPTVPNP